MDIQDKERIKDGLDAYEDAVRGLEDLYNEFDYCGDSDPADSLNDLQPLVDEDGEKIHYEYIYPASLDEWRCHVTQFVEAFKQSLDKHCSEKCPLSYTILGEQLGKKVGDWNVEDHPMTGCIGIGRGDISVLATPDWDADGSGSAWEDGELSIEITDDGNHIGINVIKFDYTLSLNEMVNNWKDAVINAGEVYEGHIASPDTKVAHAS